MKILHKYHPKFRTRQFDFRGRVGRLPHADLIMTEQRERGEGGWGEGQSQRWRGWGGDARDRYLQVTQLAIIFFPGDSLSSVIILRHLFANNITRLCSAKLILTNAYQTREQV